MAVEGLGRLPGSAEVGVTASEDVGTDKVMDAWRGARLGCVEPEEATRLLRADEPLLMAQESPFPQVKRPIAHPSR